MSANPRDEDATAALERHRAALQALTGVVSTGVSRHADGASTHVQIMVRSALEAPAVATAARVLLGRIPFEVVVIGDVTAGRKDD